MVIFLIITLFIFLSFIIISIIIIISIVILRRFTKEISTKPQNEAQTSFLSFVIIISFVIILRRFIDEAQTSFLSIVIVIIIIIILPLKGFFRLFLLQIFYIIHYNH
jgi:hypothetical protein